MRGWGGGAIADADGVPLNQRWGSLAGLSIQTNLSLIRTCLIASPKSASSSTSKIRIAPRNQPRSSYFTKTSAISSGFHLLFGKLLAKNLLPKVVCEFESLIAAGEAGC